MTPALERRLLQLAVAIAGIVPVYGGGMGALGLLSDSGHFRYLSGLLLGIGLTFWWTIPTLERRGVVYRTLAIAVLCVIAAYCVYQWYLESRRRNERRTRRRVRRKRRR